MPIPRLLSAVLLAASFLAIGSASAQVQFAAKTGVGIIAPCPSFCGGPGGRFTSDLDGGEGFSTSDSAAANADGNGQAHADLNGPTALGILKAEAVSLGSSQATAEAATMQGFYVGVGGLDSYTLDVTLTGTATGSAGVTVAIFRDTDPGTTFQYTSHAPTMFLEIYALTPDLDSLQELDLDLPSDGTAQSVSGSLTVTDLQQGDLFYVWAKLTAVGRNGTYADAYHTVTMTFTDPTGLSQTAPPAVPEADSYVLLAGGLLVLAFARRRMARRPA